MPWWPEEHPRYAEWRRSGETYTADLDVNEAVDICWGDCSYCKAIVVAAIHFRDRAPDDILWVGDGKEIPMEFKRFL